LLAIFFRRSLPALLVLGLSGIHSALPIVVILPRASRENDNEPDHRAQCHSAAAERVEQRGVAFLLLLLTAARWFVIARSLAVALALAPGWCADHLIARFGHFGEEVARFLDARSCWKRDGCGGLFSRERPQGVGDLQWCSIAVVALLGRHPANDRVEGG